MKFFTSVAALSAVAGFAVATPGFPPHGPPSRPTFTYTPPSAPSSTTKTTTTSAAASATVSCLTADTASYLVNGFGSLLTAYTNATANAILASDFTDTSDSINWLAGYPLGSTTFPSKAAFEAGQGSQPAIGFEVYSIDAVACKVVAFRWAALLGGSPIKGINILYASNLNGTSQGWQIETNYSEFNSGLWLEEIGGSCSPPGA